ncbi:unannotated protein [freshwater metagenome]|uniref:Unannotated protein n=1 Tax=freshwater metagenome TaxID=449393 RepID=A0A6J7VHT1_9ZZZZ
MNRNSTVTKHRFGSCSCYRDDCVAFTVLNRNKFAFIVLMINFDITQCRQTTWTPVNNALGAINEISVVKTFENCEHSLRKSGIHSERFARPVDAIAEPFHLAED